MVRVTLTLFFCFVTTSLAWAQRDAPLLECYLPLIAVRHAEGERLWFELVLKKETGPHEHKEHQMYLLAYLLDDEKEVLEIAADPALLENEGDADARLFLDVLLEKRLVTILETKVAEREGFAALDNARKYADGSGLARDKESFLKINTFAFSFSPTYHELFENVSQLKNFSNENPQRFGEFAGKFKMLVYVPVNSSKYASKVRGEIRSKGDLVVGNYLLNKTVTLYCRPLPYEFVFGRDRDGRTIIYVR
jgi:hypothetical protein